MTITLMETRLLAINGGGGNRETIDPKSDRDDCRLTDYFDYVDGTSMGGIIAAGIAIQTPVRQIADFYLGSAAATLRRYVFRYQTQASRSHCG